MTETDTAVVDRIVDGKTAVLLLETDDTVVDERTMAVESLPEDGQHEGAVFDVEFEDDELRELTYRPSVERERRESAQERFDRLSERLPDE
ncbi:DUF3006 family protein [Natronorubrum tibetense]|uniref:DUF3006 domain-containing protein n=1 Tax=Natronorubrum tibetense GA33 TaxID=1114856 RepID=L9VT35_9EURY|nr:DUF3006 family protein [Natronorubrum tibetense]ELY40324.1 hypothetical protein C496_12147 [Natronorubrum tibetense GA33]